MKRFILLTISLLALIFGFVSCDEPTPEVPAEPELEVTANNIAGEWKLAEWKGALAEGSYVYIAFDRRERTYTLYQNLDSFSTRKLTGSFYIETDPELGAVIRGNYDYDRGDWAHRYWVISLSANEMVWVNLDNVVDHSVYVRTQIPTEVKGE